MQRKPVSKRLRFKIFKRDEFTCMYCWKTPEKHNITLEVDHKISVKGWWWNEEENLTTSCFDCNRWKRDDSIIKWDLEKTKNELIEIKERLEQIKYISKLKEKIRKKQKELEEDKFNFIWELMNGYDEDFIHKVKVRIKNQHRKHWYSMELLRECLEVTEDKFWHEDSFYKDGYIKYFHWVLNWKLKDQDVYYNF